MAEFEVISNDTQLNTETISVQRPVEKVKSDLVTPATPVKDPEFSSLVQDSFNGLVEKIASKYELELSGENRQKILTALNKKLNQWIDTEHIDLDIDTKIETEADIKKALMRKGLEDTADGLKKLIQMMGEK